MLETLDRVGNCSAFDTEDNIDGAGFDNVDHFLPIDDIIAAGATNWSPSDLSFFCTALGKTYIFGVQMH